MALAGELDTCRSELGGIPTLQAVHAVPGSDGLLGALGVVRNRGSGIARRPRREQLGAEETGLHEHRADAERGDLGRQRLDPALHPELRDGMADREPRAR
jgi:hypothetical protein